MPEHTAVHQIDVAPDSASDIVPDIVPASDLPFYEGIFDWLSEKLRPVGLPRPLRKRLAVVVAGLVASQKATIGELTTAIGGLAISEAQPESIARRLQRSLSDARLDPSLLPLVFRPILPELLRSSLVAHTENTGTSEAHHRRFIGLTLIFDESSQAEFVHLAVVGVPIGGVVLPLAVRTWPQNVDLPAGEYWTQVSGLFQEVQEMMPAELRDHVLLVADRLSGVPRMLDILSALDWNWLLRTQGQTQVRLADGTCRPLRTLVPKPGTQWTSDPDTKPTAQGLGEGSDERTCEESDSASPSVFKAVGWRRSRVVAIWAAGQAEPWLLLTSLSGTLARVAEYAERWAIERLFLSWKSHGWEIEQSGIHDPIRLGRLLTGLAIATLWRLVFALPEALQKLAHLASRTARPSRQVPRSGPAASPRPWAAKYSLLTTGAKVAQIASLRTRTPALCWQFPLVAWAGRSWREVCRDTILSSRGQFSVSP